MARWRAWDYESASTNHLKSGVPRAASVTPIAISTVASCKVTTGDLDMGKSFPDQGYISQKSLDPSIRFDIRKKIIVPWKHHPLSTASMP
jgi:hypothetical protein